MSRTNEHWPDIIGAEVEELQLTAAPAIEPAATSECGVFRVVGNELASIQLYPGDSLLCTENFDPYDVHPEDLYVMRLKGLLVVRVITRRTVRRITVREVASRIPDEWPIGMVEVLGRVIAYQRRIGRTL